MCIRPVNSTGMIVIRISGAVPGVEPVEPSFGMSDADFVRFTPDKLPAGVPLFGVDMDQYKLFLWVRMKDKTTLLFAERREPKRH